MRNEEDERKHLLILLGSVPNPVPVDSHHLQTLNVRYFPFSDGTPIEEHNIQNDVMYAEPDYILPAIEDEYKDIISDSNPEVITNLFD